MVLYFEFNLLIPDYILLLLYVSSPYFFFSFRHTPRRSGVLRIKGKWTVERKREWIEQGDALVAALGDEALEMQRRKTRASRHETRDARHETRDTRHEIRDTGVDRRDTRYETRDTRLETRNYARRGLQRGPKPLRTSGGACPLRRAPLGRL